MANCTKAPSDWLETCYNTDIDRDFMPNKHLEHPEDTIFEGRRQALAAMWQVVTADAFSVKWDGAPAVVFGTNPENGKFFVGTKSVFNKRKVKINYSYEDIDQNHKGDLANILRLCFRYLPRIDSIVQADFIGVGPGSVYRPNTIEYKFPSQITQQIILAPHTSYVSIHPDSRGHFGVNLANTEDCYFIDTTQAQVKTWSAPKLVAETLALLPFAGKVCDKCSLQDIRKHVNSAIRCGDKLEASALLESFYAKYDKYNCGVNLNTFKVWVNISKLKLRLLENIETTDNVECFIDGKPTAHEGFVTLSDVPYKIVDRETFSKANFLLDKNWTNEKV